MGSLLDTLQLLQWGMKNFGSVCTNQNLPKRDMRRAIASGYAKSIGQVVLCDDDGCALVPERFREGFVLTDLGKEKLKLLLETAKEKNGGQGK